MQAYELAVQKFLRNGGTLKQLEETLAIRVKEYEDRVVLNYDQIDSPKHDPIVKECRGLILSKPGWGVLARSFDRFFNYAEDPAHKDFNLLDAYVEEKVDGSLISVYHDGNYWQIATRGMAFAEGETASGKTFLALFRETAPFHLSELDQLFGNARECTFVFELATKRNRVVTRYPEDHVVLLAVRDTLTGTEFPAALVDSMASQLVVRRPKRFAFSTAAELLRSVTELPALEEGYVCCLPVDGRIWRVKIKNPGYLAIAHIRNNGVISPKRAAYLVWRGEEDEYLAYFSEDQEFFDRWIDARKAMQADIVRLLPLVESIPSQKDFALAVKDSPVGSLLFLLRNKKQSIRDSMLATTDERALSTLEKYL